MYNRTNGKRKCHLYFLKRHKDFEFEPFQNPATGEQVKTLQILPQDFNSDGFFISKIKERKVRDDNCRKRETNSYLISKTIDLLLKI